MNEREMLELAAKAIGYVAYFNKADACQLTTDGTSEGYLCFWNSLTSKSDAFDLAEKLDLDVDFSLKTVIAHYAELSVDWPTDEPDAMHAITRCAAEVQLRREKE